MYKQYKFDLPNDDPCYKNDVKKEAKAEKRNEDIQNGFITLVAGFAWKL